MSKLIVMLLTATWILNTQTTAPSSNEPYRVIAGDVSTLQKELDDASAVGYRVLFGEVLEKSPETAPYRYKVLSTIRTSTMQKEIDQYAVDGYRIVSRAFFGDAAVILEKAPQSSSSPKYKLLESTGMRTMQSRIVQAAKEGFSICCVTSGYGRLMVIMQKTAESPVNTRNALADYMLLSGQPSAMERELRQKAGFGYRVLFERPYTELAGGEEKIAVLMEKMPNTTALYSYKLLSVQNFQPDSRVAALEKELNAAAFEGYRLIPGTVAEKQQGSKGGSIGRFVRDSVIPSPVPEIMDRVKANEIVAVMEKEQLTGSRYEYIVLSSGAAGGIESQMLRAVLKGYRPVEITSIIGNKVFLVPGRTPVMIMERIVP